jgi:hypothetical protein
MIVGGFCLAAQLSRAATNAPAEPVAPVRGAGVQLWTLQPPAELTAFDVPAQDAKPLIELAGIRNGRFAGQVVLASANPLRGVKVAAGDLKADGGTGVIPAARITVRYALPGEPTPKNTHVPSARFDALLDEPPVETPTRVVPTKNLYNAPRKPAGAMLPIWVTVHVPSDAAAGTYRGRLTVQAQGLPATEVPLSIRVHPWTMPEPRNYTCRNNIWQSHESSALYYGVPLWSDRHFELMGQVLEKTKAMGNGFCLLHLIKGAYHQGNSQSMVRWIRKSEVGGRKSENGEVTPATFTYDFSIFDRYLDLYERTLGKPNVLLLTVYHPYVVAKDKEGAMPGAKVTLLDKKTGLTEDMPVPDYGTPASVAFWKPVLDEAFQRISKRGWMDAVVVGTSSDNGPRTPEVYNMLAEIWPECRLMFSGHPRPGSFKTSTQKILPVTCGEQVWAAGTLRKQYPWPMVAAPARGTFSFSRAGAGMCHLQQDETLAAYRANPEMCLQSSQSGIGRVGADFWAIAVTNRPGFSIALSGDHGAHIGPSASITHFTAPGPKGPLTTTRLEMYVEGMQVREALAFLLAAVAEKKIDAELSTRCASYLLARATHNLPFQPKSYNLEVGMPYEPDWQAREEQLFVLCGEVAGKTREIP